MQTLGLLRAVVYLGLMVLCGCVTGPEVRVDRDPAADVRSYKTFSFFERVSTDTAAYSSLVSNRLKAATRAQLERVGYTYAEGESDLQVNFFLKVEDKQRLRTTPSGYYSYRAGYYGTWGNYPYLDTVDYKEGTLSIDLVDAKKKQLIWQGVAEGEVSDEAAQNPGPALDKVVARIFSNFPNAPQ